MENTLEKSQIKIGMKVALKDYNLYGDYIHHRNMYATVINDNWKDKDLPIHIQWSDGATSSANPKNIIILNGEWDL